MLGVSLVLGWQAAKLPPSRFDPLGPGSFPLALAVILGLLSLAALALTLRGRDIGRAETAMILGVDVGEAAIAAGHGWRPARWRPSSPTRWSCNSPRSASSGRRRC